MTDTFNWAPQLGPSNGSGSFRQLTAQFGDGYQQNVGDGINNEVQSHDLTFIGNAARTTAIRDFLRAHRSGQAFYWTPPLESAPLLFKVSGWRVTPQGAGNYTISTTFQQVFKP